MCEMLKQVFVKPSWIIKNIKSAASMSRALIPNCISFSTYMLIQILIS